MIGSKLIDPLLPKPQDQCETHGIKVVGGAQRLMPAHVANEYCRCDRSFKPCPSFKESSLPRTLTLDSGLAVFPLLAGLGLGFDFGLLRGEVASGRARGRASARAQVDFSALTALCQVRQEQLSELRQRLSVAAAPAAGFRP